MMKRGGRHATKQGYNAYMREYMRAIRMASKDGDLRDQFAQFALLGMVQFATSEKAGFDHDAIAMDAYMLADAMMKERNRMPFRKVKKA